ncbi:MAG: AAA family ATPase, partial [Candidatus Kaiserbacteria bacterium]|nr:AAA family ATPase [Candidatus Kaiserbacteria bacterium]
DDAYTKCLTGAQVYMICDNDTAGKNHVIDIFKSFRSHGLFFKLIQLPKIDELGDGADVTDWVEAGHTLDELRQAVKDAPVYSPDITTFKFHTAAELQKMNLPEPRWIVKDLFPVGLTVLAAQKKVGKSCLALQAAVAVAKGNPLFEQLNVDAGAVLYYAMEQSKNLNKYRLKLSLGEGTWSDRLYIRSINDPFPRMDMGGLDELEFTILSIPNIKMVIIDTWQRVAPVNSHKSLNAYERDTMSMDPLHALAHKCGIALVLITHEKKSIGRERDEFDRVMGSQGMTGVPDHVIMITRKRDDTNGKIMTISRVGREIRWAIKFNDETLTWTLLGDAGEVCRSQERQQIYEILREMDKPLSPSDVAALLEEQGTTKNYNAVKALLLKMENDGEVEKTGRGLYRHKKKLPNVLIEPINNNPTTDIPQELLFQDDVLPVEPKPNTELVFDPDEGA